jgi:hypothetical protein
MLVRVLRDARAANARTNMPEWFIQLFGCLLLLGVGLTALTERQPLLLVEGLAVALAMIGIRHALHRPSQTDDAK